MFLEFSNELEALTQAWMSFVEVQEDIYDELINTSVQLPIQ